jgi:hypothetical protein
MRLLLSAAAAVAGLLLSSSSLRAQPDVERMAHDDCSRARALGKTCVLSIGAEEIEGAALRPEGETLRVRPFIEAGSLIRLRRDFIPEILKTTAQLE